MFTAGQVFDHVGEFAAAVHRADIEFVDRVAHAIPRILRPMRVAGVGRFCHPDAQIARLDFPIHQLQSRSAAGAIGDGSHGERLPRAFVDAVIERFLFSGPELYVVALGVRLRPGDLDGVDVGLRAQIDHHPLGMQRIVIAGVRFGQVRIALPIGLQIAIGQARPAVTVALGGAAMWERIGPGMANRIAQFGAACEVTFLLGRVAPGAGPNRGVGGPAGQVGA